MFNLIVGLAGGLASLDRLLEYTDDHVKQWIGTPGFWDYNRLRNLPTLAMPETQDASSEQTARLGHVEDLTVTGGALRYRFVPDATFPPISTAEIELLAGALQISDWEFNRNHWAVKDVDLYRVLRDALPSQDSDPTVFRLPRELPRETDLVAVMMPFGPVFDDVYEALKAAVTDAGLRCARADDIWIATHIMDDIIGLLWRSTVVIADLTGKNANVFYETGIAHTLGREVIQITQSMDDVPFDLRSIRTVAYLNNGEGRATLESRVATRLRELQSRA